MPLLGGIIMKKFEKNNSFKAGNGVSIKPVYIVPVLLALLGMGAFMIGKSVFAKILGKKADK